MRKYLCVFARKRIKKGMKKGDFFSDAFFLFFFCSSWRKEETAKKKHRIILALIKLIPLLWNGMASSLSLNSQYLNLSGAHIKSILHTATTCVYLSDELVCNCAAAHALCIHNKCTLLEFKRSLLNDKRKRENRKMWRK